MGYRILSRSKHDEKEWRNRPELARHGVWSHKIYATRESAKKAYDRFYTGKYAKYKKYDVSIKIVKAKKPHHDIFGGAFRGF